MALVLVLVSGAGTGGCQSPTQVTVELRTFGALPCSSLKGVSIAVAQTPAEAEARMKLQSFSAQVPRGECGADGRTVGTLVITPSGEAGAIVVRARISDEPGATCEPPEYKGCIVARRSFSFIDHASLTLPITLEAACADVPCNVESSCRSGVCVSSKASCSEALGSCPSVAEPVPAPDGGSTPPLPDEVLPLPDGGMPDGSPDLDASPDASVDASPDATLDAPITDGNSDAPTSKGLCPTNSGPVDCALNGASPVCCFDIVAGFSCTTAFGCPPAAPHYNCTGPTQCATKPCCGGLSPPDAGNDGGDAGANGFVASCAGAALSCDALSKDTVCGSNADCPLDKPVCKKILHSLNGHTIFACNL